MRVEWYQEDAELVAVLEEAADGGGDEAEREDDPEDCQPLSPPVRVRRRAHLCFNVSTPKSEPWMEQVVVQKKSKRMRGVQIVLGRGGVCVGDCGLYVAG
eukprot:723545-Rhodomonas_salina.1